MTRAGWSRQAKDPIAGRRAERASGVDETFGRFALKLIETIETGFRSSKHRGQWHTTLTTYAAPLWNKRLADIETDDVLACLKPIFAEVPEFLVRLRDMDGIGARALEFAVLTAARTGEVLGARWQEVDLENKVWIVPAARTKAGREHRVPLTERAVEILSALAQVRTGDYVFSGARRGKPLSSTALLALMCRAGKCYTVHGFRSLFRDWAGERTSFPREIAEAALAHVVGDETERAYRRGDALEKRRALMEAWAKFCEPAAGDVVVPLARPGRTGQ